MAIWWCARPRYYYDDDDDDDCDGRPPQIWSEPGREFFIFKLARIFALNCAMSRLAVNSSSGGGPWNWSENDDEAPNICCTFYLFNVSAYSWLILFILIDFVYLSELKRD